MKTIKFKEWTCVLEYAEYGNRRTAISLIGAPGTEYEGQPIAVATVNLPDEELAEGNVFIKDYSENEGIYDCLIDAGVIEKRIRFVVSGHIIVPECKLCDEILVTTEQEIIFPISRMEEINSLPKREKKSGVEERQINGEWFFRKGLKLFRQTSTNFVKDIINIKTIEK